MEKDTTVLVIGQDGLAERALVKRLRANGHTALFSVEEELDTGDQRAVEEIFAARKPQIVILGSVLAGGIQANQDRPAEFIHANLAAAAHVIPAAHRSGVKKLLSIGSSCIYPRACHQPMRESDLLAGPMEPTSEPYATAKLAGIRLAQAYHRQYGLKAVSVIPATIYGPGEEPDPEGGHVLGSLLHKFAEAVRAGAGEVKLWGTGTPRREFLFAEDFVDAVLFLLDNYDEEEIINAGCGEDIPVRDLAGLIARVTGFRGKIVFDDSKPDGAMQKLLDSSRINALGWHAKVMLEEGILETVEAMSVSDGRLKTTIRGPAASRPS